MKLLLDTNVILDILLEREPFVRHAVQLVKIAQQRSFQLFVTATTITDLYYITRKERGKETALALIEELLDIVEVASVDKHVVLQALRSGMPDFEDAIQACSAKQEAIATIITRNESDFIASGLHIYNPDAFLQTLQP